MCLCFRFFLMYHFFFVFQSLKYCQKIYNYVTKNFVTKSGVRQCSRMVCCHFAVKLSQLIWIGFFNSMILMKGRVTGMWNGSFTDGSTVWKWHRSSMSILWQTRARTGYPTGCHHQPRTHPRRGLLHSP